MNKRLIMLMSILSVVILLANGCGGAGGTGRYTIPSDSSDGSGGGTITGTGTGTGIVAETDPDVLMSSAWDDFNYGAYSSAISKFNQVLAMASITDAQKVAANNGLGWALAKSSGIESAYSAFSQAAASNSESAVGLASVLIQRGQTAGIKQAVTLLETVGLGNTAYQFQSAHSIGVSSAEAHAMLAFAYYWRGDTGDDSKAASQISVARAEDGSNDSSVYQIYSVLLSMGLSGI